MLLVYNYAEELWEWRAPPSTNLLNRQRYEMDTTIKKTIKINCAALQNSPKRMRDLYEIIFSAGDNVLAETSDGFRIIKLTYAEAARQIEAAAAILYEKLGASQQYVALALENSPEWIVAFWAILMSGNKPYLVNLRYNPGLTNNILKTLDVGFTVCDKDYGLQTENILVSELKGSLSFPHDHFADEIAFSSSATSMNEVICFYTGYQIAEQVLNIDGIIKAQPRMIKSYKGQLKHLAFLPFYHVFGLFAVFFWFTFFGCTMVFLRDYASDTILTTCRRHQVTHIFAVPMLWHTLEKKILASAKEQGDETFAKFQKGLQLSTKLQNILPGAIGPEVAKKLMGSVTDKVFGPSVLFCINGGSYIKTSALELLNGIGYSTYNGYGMSEVGITSVELRRKPKWRNENSIGRPFASVEYKIDEEGVLSVRGSSLCVRKLVNGQEQIVDGWFYTSDNAAVKNGNYYILGRKSDMIIGENGENINPDTIEALFHLGSVNGFCVLGLGPVEAQELSIVVEVSDYVTQEQLEKIKAAVYAVNDTLQSTVAIKKFYFTYDRLSPPTAIKVSRKQLSKKIAEGTVKLIPFAQMQANTPEEGTSPLAEGVRQIVAEVLGLPADQVGDTQHIFYDLSATSIQYFDILARLSEKYGMADYKTDDRYCYTVRELCQYLEKRINVWEYPEHSQANAPVAEKAAQPVQKSRGHHGLFRLKTLPMDGARILGAPLFLLFRVRKKALDGRSYTGKVKGGAIIAANHTSFADPLLVNTAFWYRRQYFLAGEAVMEGKGKLIPLLLKGLGAIKVDRNRADLDAVNQCVEKLEEGYLLTVFPQGRIIREDDVASIKSGTALMAIRANVPIIPIHIEPGKKWYQTRNVVIGNPIDPVDFARESTSPMDHVQRVCQALAEEMARCKAANTEAPAACQRQ